MNKLRLTQALQRGQNLLNNYVYKLKPNVTQANQMTEWVNMLRSHFNWCLNDRLTQYNQQYIQGDYCDLRTKASACPFTCFVSKNGATGEPWKDSKVDKEGKPKNPRRNAGDIQITALLGLKAARPWYKKIDSTVLQQNIKRLDIAYKNFFEGRGFPRFKNRSNFTSFTYVMGIKVQENKIYLPKLGWIKFFNSRPIPQDFTIKAATIRQRQDGWYVSIRIEDKTVTGYIAKPIAEVKEDAMSEVPSDIPAIRTILGCDLGITKLIHLSDGHQINNPKFATNKKTKRLLRIRQRRVSRKVKGSKNRKRSAKQVGRLHKKISDERQAYQWKVANKITSRKVDAIAIEDLNISRMLKRCKVKTDKKTGRFLPNGQSRKKALNRSISDASWGELTFKIEYLAAKSKKVVIKVNPKFSSQECRSCKHIEKTNREKEKFICVRCGFFCHADINAARTIRDRAYKIVSETVCQDLAKPVVSKTTKRPKNKKEKSPRSLSECGEPGNLKNQDINTEMC